jgi:hypothetical protein
MNLQNNKPKMKSNTMPGRRNEVSSFTGASNISAYKKTITIVNLAHTSINTMLWFSCRFLATVNCMHPNIIIDIRLKYINNVCFGGSIFIIVGKESISKKSETATAKFQPLPTKKSIL